MRDNEDKPGGLLNWRLIVAGLIYCSVLGALDVLGAYLAVAPQGGEWLSWCLFVASMISMLLFLVAVPVALVFSLSTKWRRTALSVLICCVLFVITGRAGGSVAHRIRMNALRAAAERSAPLIEAIKAYTADHLQPPDELGVLVPRYIEQIPETGMAASPRYGYLVARPGRSGDSPWRLYVPVPGAMRGFDEFFYLPDQDYGRLGTHTPLGDWAYIYD